MYVLSILKNESGLTIGAKVLENGLVKRFNTDYLKRFSGIDVFENAIIDSNGFVRSKSGSLPCELDGTCVTLYHGSKDGINGPISVNMSNPRSDFGLGFYLGELRGQAMNRIYSQPSGVLYTYSLNKTGLKIYTFKDDVLWALYIGVNRGYLDLGEYPKLRSVVASINKSDVIVGVIADDSIAKCYREFLQGNITNVALSECLKYVKYGRQYVIKSQRVCVEPYLVEICREVLRPEQKVKSKEWGIVRKQDIDSRVSELKLKYRRIGRYCDEILEGYR